MPEKEPLRFQTNCYYRIGKTVTKTDCFTHYTDALSIAVVDDSGFLQLQQQYGFAVTLFHKDKNIRLTRLLKFDDHLLCTLNIPLKKEKLHKRAKLSLIIKPECIVILVHNLQAQALLETFVPEDCTTGISHERFLYNFFESILCDDLLFLEELERYFGVLEEGVLGGKINCFDQKMLPLRKELMYLHSYYAQLLDMFVKLQDDDNRTFFKNTAPFALLYEQTNLLFDFSQMLREYSVQIRELYQTQIDIRQNKTMKLLTGIATIFLPLTVITGWYGMNFSNMPELRWSFGYPMIFIVSLLVSLLCIYIFKKKNYF